MGRGPRYPRAPVPYVPRNPRSPVAHLLALSCVFAGCGWFDDPTPEFIRVRASGQAGTRVQVVLATQFNAAVDEAGVTNLSIFLSDTLARALPFDTTVNIALERRFFVELMPLDAASAQLDVRVEVDGRTQVAEGGTVARADPWRYAYLFNQRVTRIIDTRF